MGAALLALLIVGAVLFIPLLTGGSTSTSTPAPTWTALSPAASTPTITALPAPLAELGLAEGCVADVECVRFAVGWWETQHNTVGTGYPLAFLEGTIWAMEYAELRSAIPPEKFWMAAQEEVDSITDWHEFPPKAARQAWLNGAVCYNEELGHRFDAYDVCGDVALYWLNYEANVPLPSYGKASSNTIADSVGVKLADVATLLEQRISLEGATVDCGKGGFRARVGTKVSCHMESEGESMVVVATFTEVDPVAGTWEFDWEIE
jgi:hypothetical protein